jgi:hypothetical protein
LAECCQQKDEGLGYYQRFKVWSNRRKEWCTHPHFTLFPMTDPAAREAIHAYIDATPNTKLANDLISLLDAVTPPDERF